MKYLKRFYTKAEINNIYKNNIKYDIKDINKTMNNENFISLYSFNLFKESSFNEFYKNFNFDIEKNFQNLLIISNSIKNDKLEKPIINNLKEKFFNYNNIKDINHLTTLVEYNSMNNIDLDKNLINEKLNSLTESNLIKKYIESILENNTLEAEITNKDLELKSITLYKLCILKKIDNENVIKLINKEDIDNLNLMDIQIILELISNSKYESLINKSFFIKIQTIIIKYIYSIEFNVQILLPLLKIILSIKNSFSGIFFESFNQFILKNIKNLDYDNLVEISYYLKSIQFLNYKIYENIINNYNSNTCINNKIMILNILLMENKENNLIKKIYDSIDKNEINNLEEGIKMNFLFINFEFNLNHKIFEQNENIKIKFEFKDDIISFINKINSIYNDLKNENEIEYFNLYFKSSIEKIIESRKLLNEEEFLWLENILNKYSDKYKNLSY